MGAGNPPRGCSQVAGEPGEVPASAISNQSAVAGSQFTSGQPRSRGDTGVDRLVRMHRMRLFLPGSKRTIYGTRYREKNARCPIRYSMATFDCVNSTRGPQKSQIPSHRNGFDGVRRMNSAGARSDDSIPSWRTPETKLDSGICIWSQPYQSTMGNNSAPPAFSDRNCRRDSPEQGGVEAGHLPEPPDQPRMLD